MATKNGKLVGNTGQTKEYWQNAAKQFIWPIDFDDLQILVPEKDLKLAEDNLMVSHFRAHGWHIQSSIQVEYTKPYVDPIFTTAFKPVKIIEELEPEFRYGQRFKIKSTDCELKITSIDKKSISLEYINRQKDNIVTNADNLNKSLRMGVWLKL